MLDNVLAVTKGAGTSSLQMVGRASPGWSYSYLRCRRDVAIASHTVVGLVKKRTGSRMYPCLTGNKLLVVQTDADGLRVMLLFLRRFGEQMCTTVVYRRD